MPSLGKVVARAAGKGLATPLKGIKRKGRLHILKKAETVQRFTNSPRTDVIKGLPKEGSKNVRATRIHPGRKGSIEHIQHKLKIDHPVKAWGILRLQPGTKYSEGTVKNGLRGAREMKIPEHIPGSRVTPEGN